MTTLDSFTRGYIAALLGTMASGRLAPETLAQIMEDCAEFRSPKVGAADWFVFDRLTGGDFWRDRQGRQLTRYSSRRFPPLTPYLGNDGLIYLKEAQTNDH